MNVNMSINQTPLILKEGVLANNDILDYNEFYNFMKEHLSEKVLKGLFARFNMISGHIKAGRYKKAYLMWENLEKDILLNNDYAVSLLFIENINSPDGNYNYKYSTKEYDVLSNRGKLTHLKQLNSKLMQENLEEQISQHLFEFISDVQTKNLRWKFIQEVFNMGDSDCKKNAAEARWRTHDWTYKNILYGNNPVWQGNVADAFMNHIAHFHIQILAAENINNENLFATSVFNEEKENIFNLLYASRNDISWITGGDIIVKYNNQIYNIQLKTGQVLEKGKKRSQVGGKLAVADLLKFIEELKSSIKTADIDIIIQKMYNELKTSGWVENTNQAISKTAENLINLNKT